MPVCDHLTVAQGIFITSDREGQLFPSLATGTQQAGQGLVLRLPGADIILSIVPVSVTRVGAKLASVNIRDFSCLWMWFTNAGFLGIGMLI